MNKKFKIASILMIIHGALMEAGTGIYDPFSDAVRY